jgi:hypothetical protein
MGGLYNMVFKTNLLASRLFAVLSIKPSDVIDCRLRDCFLNEEGTEIIIYTRTGGGNREEYKEANDRLRKINGFIGDSDDSFDCTYALFRYAIPEEFQGPCKELGPTFGVDPAKRWKETIESLERMIK